MGAMIGERRIVGVFTGPGAISRLSPEARFADDERRVRFCGGSGEVLAKRWRRRTEPRGVFVEQRVSAPPRYVRRAGRFIPSMQRDVPDQCVRNIGIPSRMRRDDRVLSASPGAPVKDGAAMRATLFRSGTNCVHGLRRSALRLLRAFTHGVPRVTCCVAWAIHADGVSDPLSTNRSRSTDGGVGRHRTSISHKRNALNARGVHRVNACAVGRRRLGWSAVGVTSNGDRRRGQSMGCASWQT